MSGLLLAGAAWLPFLAALAAKATLVLGVAALAAALLGRASAAVRHLVWLVGIVGVLALPVFSLLLPRWEVPVLPAAPSASPASPLVSTPLDVPAAVPMATRSSAIGGAAGAGPVGAPAEARTAWLPRATVLLAMGGVVAGLAWLALGFWGVARLGRRAEVVRDAEWLHAVHDAAERLGLRRPVLLLRARGAVMPATGGILWPAVVLPEKADAWPHDRRHAVLAHELAHVKRFDCLTQALAQVACALFWWHPAVWYAARRLRVERERACDDLVLGMGTRASDYASHLLEIARSHRGSRMAAPALVSMARPSHLESRLLWVLDAARRRGAPSPRATLLTVLAAGLLVLPLAAFRPTEASARPASDIVDAREKKGAADEETPGSSKKGGHSVPALADARTGAHAEAHAVAPDTVPEDSLELLIAMHALGVDAAYVRELREAGYDGLSAGQLVELRATGVTGPYAGEMNAAGWGRLSPGDLARLGAVGVTTAWLEEMRGAGVRPATPEAATELRALGVDAAYIRSLEGVGLTGLSGELLGELRAHHVDADYVRELRAAGFAELTPEQLVRLRASGVDGELIQSRRRSPARP